MGLIETGRMMKIINPLELTFDDLPLFVLSDDLRSFISWGIRAHSKGNYNHIMMMVRPRVFATQSFLYKEVNIKKFMKPSVRMKFWQPQIDNITKIEITDKVEKALEAPWWKRRYDFLGVAGQFLNIRWIQVPYLNYCSEREAENARLIPFCRDIPKRPTPADMNRYFKTKTEMKVLGYWFEED